MCEIVHPLQESIQPSVSGNIIWNVLRILVLVESWTGKNWAFSAVAIKHTQIDCSRGRKIEYKWGFELTLVCGEKKGAS